MTGHPMIRRALAFCLPGALLVGGLLVAGCGSARYGYTASATVSTPDMVMLDNGVWVVANYDDPVFYGGDYYWRYDGGYWYRSSYLGGWNRVSVGVVPPRIRGIDRPRRYRRYVPPRRARVRAVPQRHYQPHVRRAETRVRTPRSRVRVQPNQPRYDRRGAQVERRMDRRDARRDRRMDRREQRFDRRTERREARRGRARPR